MAALHSVAAYANLDALAGAACRKTEYEQQPRRLLGWCARSWSYNHFDNVTCITQIVEKQNELAICYGNALSLAMLRDKDHGVMNNG